MAEFFYKGVDRSGNAIDGIIEATDKRAAISELAAQGHFVSELLDKAVAGSHSFHARLSGSSSRGFSLFKSSRITGKDIVAMTTQLSTALRAGLQILDALHIIAQQQAKEPLKKLLEDLGDAVRHGESLSGAMEKYPKIFSKLYISMVQVGETGGILDQTFIQLSKLLVRDEKIKTNMKNALMYPSMVMFAGIVSVIIMLTVVFPKMIETIGSTTQILPLPTRMLMGFSDFLLAYGWLAAIGLFSGIYFFIRWKNSQAGKLQFDTALLKLPIFGPVLRAISVGRFARTLGSLAKSGINILPALAVVRDTLGNELLAKEIDSVAEQVKTGSAVAEPLASSGLFPPLLIQIVNIGEQTGTIDELLLNAADTFDDEADTAITRFMAIFPALLIVSIAAVIAFIIFASLLPILSMDLGGVGI